MVLAIEEFNRNIYSKMIIQNPNFNLFLVGYFIHHFIQTIKFIIKQKVDLDTLLLKSKYVL